MGGIIILGFARQPDYISDDYLMRGYIYRLSTIGAPQLSSAAGRSSKSESEQLLLLH